MAIHPKQFGIVLKNARMDKKLTQAELAEILDISLSFLYHISKTWSASGTIRATMSSKK